MGRGRSAGVLVGSVLVAAALVAAPARAQEPAPAPEAAVAIGPNRCTQRQVDTRLYRYLGVSEQALSADGERLVYDSWTLVGTYYVPDDERVHLYDAGTRTRTDLTSPLYGEARYPRISADGAIVVFGAQAVGGGSPLDAVGPNAQVRPDGSGRPERAPEIIIRPSGDEVFAYDVATDSARQLSPPGDGAESFPIDLSANGDRVLYWAETDESVYATLGPYALRVYDASDNATVEVVPDVGYWGLGAAAISPDGTMVAFTSDRDLLGENPDLNLEVFLFDVETGRLDQLTATEDDTHNWAQSFTDDGRLLQLASEADLVGGGARGETVRYLYDLLTDSFRLRSELGPEGELSEDGSHIATASSENPVGTNADRGVESWLFDVATGRSSQVTETPHRDEYLLSSDVSATGSALAFTTGAQRPGASNRLVLATGCDPAPRPDATIGTTNDGPFVGDDVYWALGSARQKQVVAAGPRSTTRFTVPLQNDRAATDVLRLDGDFTPVSGYRVRYLRGDVDVTQQVEAGTYFTEAVPAGAATVVTIEVTTAGRRATGPNVVVDLTARSWTNPIARDAVRAKVRLA